MIGCGEVANFGHLPAIVSNPSFELVGLFEPDPVRRKATAARYGNPPVFDDLNAFYKAGLDAIAITSPAPTHHVHVMRAAQEDVHVLCEKPISEDEGEAIDMEKAMLESGKIFTIGYCYRFSPVSQQIQQWIRSDLIGKIGALRFIYLWNLHGRYEQGEDGTWSESSRWRGRMLEGGPMVDCGVHFIDLARMWTGSEVVRHHGSGAWMADYEAPDHMWLHLDHANGAHTSVELAFSFGHTAKEPMNRFSYDLIGDGGTIRYERDGYLLEARNGQGTIRVPGSSEKNFPGMYDAFAAAIKSGDPSALPTANDGLIATRLARSATNEVIQHRLRPTS